MSIHDYLCSVADEKEKFTENSRFIHGDSRSAAGEKKNHGAFTFHQRRSVNYLLILVPLDLGLQKIAYICSTKSQKTT